MKREYPDSPIISVGELDVKKDRFLLARRGKEPLKDVWTLPGGAVELGERLQDAIVREIFEECRIRARPLGIIEVFEKIFRDSDGKIKFHYVIVDFLLEYISGEAEPMSDSTELKWITLEELGKYNPPDRAVKVIKRGLYVFKRLKNHPETLIPLIKTD